MDFFKRLFASLSAPAGGADARYRPLAARCARCGEVIHGRVDLANDLSAEYDDAGRTTYVCRKVLLGQARCFQTVEIRLTFDANYTLLDRAITGGAFVDA